MEVDGQMRCEPCQDVQPEVQPEAQVEVQADGPPYHCQSCLKGLQRGGGELMPPHVIKGKRGIMCVMGAELRAHVGRRRWQLSRAWHLISACPHRHRARSHLTATLASSGPLLPCNSVHHRRRGGSAGRSRSRRHRGPSREQALPGAGQQLPRQNRIV